MAPEVLQYQGVALQQVTFARDVEYSMSTTVCDNLGVQELR